jgi:HAD superfamily hydrolase (TIGR01509 family)
MIKAVIFDIDGVLLDSFDAAYKFLEDLSAFTQQKKPNRLKFDKLTHWPLKVIFQKLHKIQELEKAEELLKVALKKVKVPTHLFKFHPGSNEAVKLLYKKYKLAIVTSRRKEGLKTYFDYSKNRKYFKVAVYLEQVKNHKPHPESLLLACKKLKVKPSEAIYVGDALTDVKAAHAAGMKVIVYNKKPIKSADININNFKNLGQAITNISNNNV